MNQPRLTCLLCPDLLPWEKQAVVDITSALSQTHPVDIQEISGDLRDWGRRVSSGTLWLVARDWMRALRMLPANDAQRIYCSAMGSSIESDSLATLFLRRIKPALGKKVRLLVHSHFNFRFYREMEGVPPAKIVHLPLPAPTGDSPPSSAPVEEVIGAAGAFSTESNFNYLLNVAHAVVQRRPQTRFVFWGRGPLGSHLEKAIGDLGLGHQCTVLAARDGHPAPAFRAMLFAPLRNEHFLPVFLGASAGIPVLCGEVPGVEEIVSDGRDGFVINVNDTEPMAELILRLIEDGELSSFYGRRLREKVLGRFSLDKVAPAYARLFFSTARWATPERRVA